MNVERYRRLTDVPDAIARILEIMRCAA